MRVNSGATVAMIPLDRIAADFQRAELRFEGIRPPVPSYELRVFIDEPQASARTPTHDNPHYLGSQFFYGLGVAEGAAEQSARREIPLNVTQRFRAYAAQTGRHLAPLSVVAVDRDGNEITAPDLDLEGITLVTS